MERNELKKYMGMGLPRGYLIGTGIYAGFAAGFVLMANALDNTNSFDFGLILLCTQWPTAVVLGIHAVRYLRMQCFFSRLKRNGRLDAILEDFRSAKCFVNDQMRMGENYIYIKGKRKLLSYDEVCGLHQAVETIAGKAYEYKLLYKTPTGKERELCKLDFYGNSYEDLQRIQLIVDMKRNQINWPKA